MENIQKNNFREIDLIYNFTSFMAWTFLNFLVHSESEASKIKKKFAKKAKIWFDELFWKYHSFGYIQTKYQTHRARYQILFFLIGNEITW